MKTKQSTPDLCNVVGEVKLAYKVKGPRKDASALKSSEQVYEAIYPLYDADQIELREEFIVFLLNRANKPLGWVKISSGGLAGTMCDVRMVMQAAILANASGLILSHNHPSGSLMISEADIEITRRVKEAGKILDITVLDHIVVAPEKGKYYSFADNGTM